jgi:trehalose synthase
MRGRGENGNGRALVDGNGHLGNGHLGNGQALTHSYLSQVPLGTLSLDLFATVMEPEDYQECVRMSRQAAQLFRGRRFLHVNSTASGGGVAEMLQSIVPYMRGMGIDCHWIVIRGNEEFFEVTKRIHNQLHGNPGDGGNLGEHEHAVYQAALEPNAREIVELVKPGDVVLLHDPQTAGLARYLAKAGAVVMWRSHVGLDVPNDVARHVWDFLRPYVNAAHAHIFSRRAFAWEGLAPGGVSVMPPSIDAFSAKNQEMDASVVEAILCAAGLLETQTDATPSFIRDDGSVASVRRKATIVDGAHPAPRDAKLAVQISRWDTLKDPFGVMEGFTRALGDREDAYLMVVGPAVDKVTDDPEGLEVLRNATAQWRALPSDVRDKIALVTLPMEDIEENAAIVNALQRRADVIVQKSLAEGFGLTVSEAMWKARPVIAGRVGGLQDQIEDGVSGILVDPTDVDAYGAALVRLLEDEATGAEMGRRARRRVCRNFLHPKHIRNQVELAESLLTRALTYCS